MPFSSTSGGISQSSADARYVLQAAGSFTGLTSAGFRDATGTARDVTLAFNSASAALTAGRTLTIDMGNVAHTLAFGTTANTITFPNAASYTVAGLGVAQTFSALQTLTAGLTLSASSSTGTLTGFATFNGFSLRPTSGGTPTVTIASSFFKGVGLSSDGQIQWSTTSNSEDFIYGASSIAGSLRLDASNELASRNGTYAQKFRVYGTYTDASNYVRLSFNTTSTTIGIACETAGTGADDLDLSLTPAGTGLVRFGSHAAIGSEVVTGYISIKDAGGTTRKIAVIS